MELLSELINTINRSHHLSRLCGFPSAGHEHRGSLGRAPRHGTRGLGSVRVHSHDSDISGEPASCRASMCHAACTLHLITGLCFVCADFGDCKSLSDL